MKRLAKPGQRICLLPGASNLWKAIKRLMLLGVFTLLSGFSYAQAEPDAIYTLQVLEMDETGVVLEFRLFDFSIGTRLHDGETYQTVAVPGLFSMTGPGQPQLPGLGQLLGTPPDGIARINILETETESINGVRLLPTASLTFPDPEGPPVETFSPDTALYSRDAYFPGPLAEPGLTGRLRDQPVAQVRLHPFQYNPVQQRLEVYRRLRIQLLFSPPLGPQADPPARPDTPYEQVLAGSLLNYGALPPVPPPPPPVAPQDISAQNTGPALKIFVEEDGLYQVTYADLQSAGFPLDGLDPRNLRLTNRGEEVAIHIQGEADGVFDPGDWLEFYGLAPISEFTRRNVYWLTTGDSPGLRMAAEDGAPVSGGSTPTAFYTTLHLEENHEYWKTLPDGEGQDHWFWERFPSAPHTSNYTFTLQNIAAIQADAFVRVSLHGRTSVSVVNPDHHTQIRLNGTLIDEAWWDGETPFVHEVTVSQQLLQEGSNTLTVKTPGDTGAGVDSLYLNGFDVGYWDTYTAENNRLAFTAPEAGTTTFVMGNFTNEAIHVYDISHPSQVKRLLNGSIEAEGSTYQVRVSAEASPDARYLALIANQKRSPADLLLDTPSSWKLPENGADYLIITHQDFTEAVARLADQRAGQGLRVTTIQMTDLYDEFSHGLFDPQAIRDFLNYAYQHWTPPAPLYVLLVGDANYDYKDYLLTGNDNYVPTHLLESNLIGQTPTDNWFVSISGDDPLPDMFIGRLSVRTLAQANAVVDKLLAYEQNPPDGDWKQGMLFVADDETSFETISDQLIATLPAVYTPRRIYATGYAQPYDPTSDIIEAVDQGTLIVTYIGHGSVTAWGSWSGKNIFKKSDIADLNNGPRYPFLVTGNCNNGLFAHPTTLYALAEEFVRITQKGGIAAWSPTGLGYASWHNSMAESLYQTMFGDFIYQLGPAITAAKLRSFGQLGWSEPIEIFTLFGDPATALQVVQPRLSLDKMTLASQVQAGQLLTYTLTYANLGNQPAENVVLTETYDMRTQFYSASPSPTVDNNIWQIGSLSPGASGMITVTVRVEESVPNDATLVNQAMLSGDDLNTEVASVYTLLNSFTYLPVILK